MLIKDGHELITTGGIPRHLEDIMTDYTAWVVSRVHLSKALLQPVQTADQYPFHVMHADLGSMGFAAEASEVLDEHKKLFYHGKAYPEQRRKIVEEMGDTFWYMVLLMEAHHITFQEIVSGNVDKLVKKDGLASERFDDRAKPS